MRRVEQGMIQEPAGKEYVALQCGHQVLIHESPLDPLLARLAATMGEVYYSLGLYPEAREILEDALADLRSRSDLDADAERASVSNNLAAILHAQGHFAQR